MRFFQRLFNHVTGNLLAFGSFDHVSQCRIIGRIGHTVLGSDVELLAVLRIKLGLLTGGLEYRRLAIFETSAHENDHLPCYGLSGLNEFRTSSNNILTSRNATASECRKICIAGFFDRVNCPFGVHHEKVPGFGSGVLAAASHNQEVEVFVGGSAERPGCNKADVDSSAPQTLPKILTGFHW